ncbi:MAG: folate/biopterin family MFS transporter [Candidatus Glassbacteria bacterium]|nr:folate/biopterin family MFS transporter [Candidatus Glassbacteria bacterium]
MLRLYILFAAIYLIEGITEVPFILNVYLRNVLEFEPSRIGNILFLGGIWFVVVKPVVGLLADGWRRFNTRLALVIGLACSAGGWAIIANANSPQAMLIGISLKIMAIAVLDVLIDGMIVATSTARNRSFIQSLVYGCRFGGAMLTAEVAGGMIGDGAAAFVQIYYFYSLLALAALLPVLLFRREEVESRQSLESKGGLDVTQQDDVPLGQRLRQLVNPAFGWLLALYVLYNFGPDTSTFFDPILEERFSSQFLGRINVIYYLGTLAGILLFPLLRLRVGVKTMFFVSLIGWSLVEISCLWISEANGALIYCSAGLFNAFSELALLTVAAAMCKIRGIQTFAFASALSVGNLIFETGKPLGGCLLEAVGIEWLFVISALCGFLPFLVLHRIDFRKV